MHSISHPQEALNASLEPHNILAPSNDTLPLIEFSLVKHLITFILGCLFNISIASEASISSSYKLIISIPILIKLSSKVNSSFKIYSSLSKILSL